MTEQLVVPYADITCSTHRRCILGPLRFLIYVNNLPNASNLLNSIMFGKGKNMFYSHLDIKTLSMTIKNKLRKIRQWFRANTLSLNVKKTKYTFSFNTSFTIASCFK